MKTAEAAHEDRVDVAHQSVRRIRLFQIPVPDAFRLRVVVEVQLRRVVQACPLRDFLELRVLRPVFLRKKGEAS